jgi:hypothetical protein
METLVWGLFLMIQNPERWTTPDHPANGCETLASLGVTFARKVSFSAVALQSDLRSFQSRIRLCSALVSRRALNSRIGFLTCRKRRNDRLDYSCVSFGPTCC